jgi:putative DNA primase/helicase
MNLRHIARLLGGEITGQQVSAPGPGHSKHDRSMAVFIDATSADGFRVHSFSNDDWKVCRDYVKARLGIAGGPSPRPEPAPVRDAKPVKDDADRTAFALSIWREARDIRDTPAAVYLASRGIDLARLPQGIGEALRWHPSCPWEGGKHGAMVGLLTDAITGEPKAVHRTALTFQGKKVDKKMLGPSGGCVVRLWPDETVSTGLVLGEGIETTLSAATRLDHKGTLLIPAWAACSAVAMAKFPVLPGVECLTLLVDNDRSGAGQRAAMECSRRWTMADREVIRLMPDIPGEDFNDVAMRGAA